MGFFDRNRRALEARGIDPARLPPGQYATDRIPVLHVGDVPRDADDLSDWDLRLFGSVDEPRTLTFDELTAFPAVEETFDIHCVTKWSEFDTRWRGVRLTALMDLVEVDVLVGWAFDGEPLEPEHGHPVRLRALEFTDADQPGFWERNGYHNDADPFLEQRHWGD